MLHPRKGKFYLKALEGSTKGCRMQNRSLLLLTLLAVAACASTPGKQAASPTSTAAVTVQAACPAVPDVQELLARHARTFGSKEAVAAALPRSFAGETLTQGKKGSVEFALDRQGRSSLTTVVGGMQSASGIDAKGPWSLP
jgi:hypothetical protein